MDSCDDGLRHTRVVYERWRTEVIDWTHSLIDHQAAEGAELTPEMFARVVLLTNMRTMRTMLEAVPLLSPGMRVYAAQCINEMYERDFSELVDSISAPWDKDLS